MTSRNQSLALAVVLLTTIGCLLAGCKKPETRLTGEELKKSLTPDQYQLLSDRERIRYKDIVVRVPHTLGGMMLPAELGAYPNMVDRLVGAGDTFNLMGLYSQALFQTAFPRVKIEYANFDVWSNNYRQALAVAISSGRAPSYYVARDLPQTIEQGMYADITPLLKKWDQFHLQPEASRHEGTVDGRMYTVGQGELSGLVIRYRKDWFREAGIFNEFGEPGPRTDWTWEDFRRIARRLTDRSKNRYGYVGEMGDFQFNKANGLDPLFIPDSTGKRTWVFNDKDPLLLESLKNAREMVSVEKSVYSTGSLFWFEIHSEFDGGRAAMIESWAAHPPRESLEQPFKYGEKKLYADTVGMVAPPRGPSGLYGLKPLCNNLGFDPTLRPEQLEAAFEWVKSYNYGELFLNRIHQATQDARIKGRRSTLYAEMLAMPYQPKQNPLDQPFEKVFPPDYLRTFKEVKESHYPPLPREFGLREPPDEEFRGAVRALYSEAVSTKIDIRELVRKHARLINTNLLDFSGHDESAKMRRYIDARSEFYRKYFPSYYASDWKRRLETYYRAP